MPKRKNKGKAKPPPKSKGPPAHQTRQKFNLKGNRDDSPFARPHGYTLADEARNTASNRRGARGRDARLRSQPVVFVSAGFMDPLKDVEISKNPDVSIKEEAADPNPDVEGRSDSNAIETGLSHIDLADSGAIAQHETNQLQDEQSAAQSDVDSDSSEEVILFKGRDASRQQQNPPSPKPTGSVIESTDISVQQETNHNLTLVKETTCVAMASDLNPQMDDLDFISLEPSRSKRASSRRRRSAIDSDEEDEEAAIIADYIANTQIGFDDDGSDDEEDVAHPGLGSRSFNILRDLGGTDSDAIPSQPSSEGDSENDMEDDSEAEREYELAVEDERLAQLLAKQEELGLCGDDVLLLDGADADDGWIVATSLPRRKTKRGSRKSRMFQGGSQFPNATRMADAFDELDLMDMQGSRLQRSKKGPISFGLSDSELEDALNVAIKKDRLKKADKKKAREELRSQGLLGKNVNPSDLRVKYQGGMSLDDLAEEFEAFMLSTREQLILPPFDKGARKIVHTIANTFKIKSKSAGAGTGRYPVLYRSKATLPYDQDLFEHAFSRVRRTWFPRLDADEGVVQTAKALKRAEARTGNSRKGKSSLVLREGDIVGQHASEIGVENKGRAMLEKMGWTKGMSLGTVETQGIIVPLTHVIKKTKAGLGDI